MKNFKDRINELMKKLPKDIAIPSPDDSWAQVELYRWQYGELPPQDETCKKLDVCKGLDAMASAIEKHDVKNFPSPVGVMAVLRYTAKLLRPK